MEKEGNMASYIARVELHSATYADYEILHPAMAAQGFQRYIYADTGSSYWLPTGTYAGTGLSIDRATALSRAQAAATKTGKSYSAIIAEYSGANWIGLEKRS